MPADPHRVTRSHVRALAAADRMRGERTCLADTDDGIRFVTPGAVLTPGSGVRRLLMCRVDLVEDAANAGQTLAAYVAANAGRIAADLNERVV